MRATKKKSGQTVHTTFHFTGDLEKEVEKAKKELEQKEGSREQEFLTWQYERAKKAIQKYNGRINDLRDFIKIAEEKLQERETQEAAGE